VPWAPDPRLLDQLSDERATLHVGLEEPAHGWLHPARGAAMRPAAAAIRTPMSSRWSITPELRTCRLIGAMVLVS
jgi:hypothetical protein